MNRTYQQITAFSLALILLASPAISSAKENGNKGKSHEDKQEKVEKAEREEARHCLKAFGHLISKGFIKNKGEVEFDANCFMPFGIKKKFGGAASSTDSVAPVITHLSVRPNSNKALITWVTNEPADSAVFWSTSPNVNVNSSSTMSALGTNKLKVHAIVITNLSASTTYYLVVRSKDASGNTSVSSETSFTTHGATTTPLDMNPPVVSELSYLPGTTTVAVSWKTNEDASSRVYFSTTSPVAIASTTANVFNATLAKTHLVTISGLNASSTYYFAVESVDASGNKTASPTFSATTTN